MKHAVNKRFIYIFAVMMAAFISSVPAQAATFRGVVGLGYDSGGDVLFRGIYTSGSTWEVRANQGLLINGGVVMATGSFETQLTVGYKFGGPTATNGSVTFDVIPVEVMEFYRTSNVRMGLGLSYHNSPKVVVDVPGSSLNGTYKFDNAMGIVAQIGWAPVKSPFSIDLRYTGITYKQSNISNAKDTNANAIGVYASFFF